MTRKRIRNILEKEWEVLARDPSTMLLIVLIPFLILGEAIVVIWLVAKFGAGPIIDNPFFQGPLSKFVAAVHGAADLEAIDQVRLFLLAQLNFFILLIPTMIAINSTAYSIVEEKLSRSLEPLLATPVRTWELMFGKALAGAIPALAMTWLIAAVSLLPVVVLGWGRLIPYFVNATWFLDLFLLAPCITVLSFLLGVIGSSRAKDARSAQNLVLFIIFPVLGLIAVQLSGLVWFTPLLTLALSIGVGLIDVIVLRIAVRLFHRESIVIAWR